MLVAPFHHGIVQFGHTRHNQATGKAIKRDMVTTMKPDETVSRKLDQRTGP